MWGFSVYIVNTQAKELCSGAECIADSRRKAESADERTEARVQVRTECGSIGITEEKRVSGQTECLALHYYVPIFGNMRVLVRITISKFQQLSRYYSQTLPGAYLRMACITIIVNSSYLKFGKRKQRRLGSYVCDQIITSNS